MKLLQLRLLTSYSVFMNSKLYDRIPFLILTYIGTSIFNEPSLGKYYLRLQRDLPAHDYIELIGKKNKIENK